MHCLGADLENPFKTNGVRVCPVAQFDFFSREFDTRERTMVVFCKEGSVRQLQLITPENEGGDDASSPSPPRFTFFDDPDVPLDPPDTPPAPPVPPGPPRFTWTATRIAHSSSTFWWERKSKS